MLELTGNIDDDGTLRIFQKNDLFDWIYKNRGKAITLTLKTNRRTRSSNQNAYYWGVVVKLIQERLVELGHEVSELETHEFLKGKFNYRTLDLEDGHSLDLPCSTKELTTVDFMIYVEKIQQFASQMLGVYIPDPNQQLTIDL